MEALTGDDILDLIEESGEVDPDNGEVDPEIAIQYERVTASVGDCGKLKCIFR